MKQSIFLNEQELSLIVDFNLGKQTRTKKAYKREINGFRQFIDKELIKATTEDGRNYIAFLKIDGKAPSTIRRIYDQLNVFYNYLFIEGHIKLNLFHKIEKPPASKQVRPERTPSPEDLEKLLITLKEDFELRDFAAILLILTTGLRVSQALNVKWNEFIHAKDHIGLKISYEAPKYIRIFDFVWEAIEQYREYIGIPKSYLDKNYYVFINHRNIDKYINEPHSVSPITSDWIRKVMEKACSKAGIGLYTAKDLRHAFAVYTLNLAIANSDKDRATVINEVTDQMGWSSMDQVNRYTGVIEQLLYPAGAYTESFFQRILNSSYRIK